MPPQQPPLQPPPQPPPTQPPPGWYPDPYGQLRWWDGTAWGVAAAGPTAGSSSGRTLAILAHLGCVLGGFLLPLIIYATADPRDRYLRHHASEALNFQLTFIGVWFLGFAVWMVGIFAGAGLGSAGGEAAAGGVVAVMIVFWLVMMAAMLANWAFGVTGAVRASQGVWWRYPICIRFVQGAVDPTG